MAESASIPVLHSYWRSSAAYRAHRAGLKGQPYRSVTWQMAQGEHLQPAYRRLAPFGLVPMLDIDGLRLQQSLAIIEYLEERNPEPALLPPGRAARARAARAGAADRLRGPSAEQPARAQAAAHAVRRRRRAGRRVVSPLVPRGLFRLRGRAGRRRRLALRAGRRARHRRVFPDTAGLQRQALRRGPGAVCADRRHRAGLRALPAFQAASPENQPDAPRPRPPRVPPEPRSPIAVPRRPRPARPPKISAAATQRQTMQPRFPRPAPPSRRRPPADQRRRPQVLAATLVGSTIEWYDYFIYSQAAGLVLGALFFAPSPRTIRNGR